ncbi:hypothetical protein BGZ51_003206 [Haplosporangium sp. Z 767]|nr:hypothetical protein BGZ51_003206 [Haplosporangium sp. Z 767]
MTSPLDLIRLTLVELIDDMNGDSSDSVDSQASATNICNLAMSDLKEEELDMAASLLFNPDRGLMYFLKKSLDKSIHGNAKVIFLDFTAEFISRAPKSITPYIVDIKRTCLSLFLNDSQAKVRRSSILPIKILLSSCNTLIDPDALEISGLFAKLFTAYATQQSKMASTVKAEVLEVLGIIARYYPKIAEERHTMIMRWCLSTVQEQLKPGAKHELSLVAGALIGLDNFLYGFAHAATKDVPTILQIVKTLVNVPEDLSRFATPIAALDLFAHHIHLFRSKLIDIYEWMYQRIASYCEHSHIGMSKCGYKSLDVFLQEMADVLTSSETTEREYSCFLFFTANFTQIISTEVITSMAQYKAMSVAIRGYGYFAAPCKHIAPDQLKNLLSHLLRKSSFLVSSNTNEGVDSSTTHLAAFITAYAFVAQVYDEVPELLMTALNQMANAAVVSFTKMSTYARIDCTIAIEKLLVMLYRKGEGVLRGVFDKLSYKLLVFTSADIAKPVAGPSRTDRQPVGEEATWHSYMIYLFLWRNLFKPGSLSKELNKTYDELSGDDEERFLRIIYGCTMESFKRLVSLLNLSVSDADMNLEDELASGITLTDMEPIIGAMAAPTSGDVGKMQANCAKDFIIFQNLTEFWQLFLPEIRPDLFSRWTFVIGDTLIELSAKHPLVSGFYKMFATCLQVCQSISFFKQSVKAGQKLEDGSVDVQRAAILFMKYITEVLARLEQYKDDLLASCLHLVLSSPTALTEPSSVIAPIQLALKLGLGYFPLASIGLDAIERWIEVVEHDQTSWFSQVLPPLNEYLLVQVSSAEENDAFGGMGSKTRKKVMGDDQSYKAIARSASMLTTAEQVQSLHNLQLRILRLLGRQAGYNKLLLGQRSFQDGAKKDSSDLLAWDPEARVRFKIPFQEMKSELQLDEMLPRIVDLAENSLNRQIKVASCELLHSLVILMIGSSAFRARDAQNPKKSPFHKIYLKVFPALLRLAVDVDQVPRSLYRPLVSQLIHWLTNSAQYENPETIALLSCCMDAACDTLGPLRDYGAECLGEFVKWSIKQTSTSSSVSERILGPFTGHSSSVNVKSVLKRVYNLASHSNPAKRLGASLIVNRIYRVFREEAPLVNQFTMELLYWMLFGLRLAEGDHAGLGTRQQACLAITHLQRIIQIKSAVFIKDSHDRRRIPGLEEANLESLVSWLLKETSRVETEYTKMCRTLFDSFVKLLPDLNFVTARKVISFVSLMVIRNMDRGDGTLIEVLKTTTLLGPNFYLVLAACLLNPDSIGNDELLKNEAETKSLRTELETALRALNKLPADSLASFGSALMETITSGDLIPLALSPDVEGQDPVKCKGVIDGLELVQHCGMLATMFEGSSLKASQYVASLYETFMTMQSTQAPLWINYCSALLRLSMTEPQCCQSLWMYLLDPENIVLAKMTYLKYADEINRQLAMHFDELTPLLERSATSSPLLLSIWNDFLDYMFSHPQLALEKNTFLDMLTTNHSVLEKITAEFESVFNRAILNLMPTSSSEYERGSSKFKDYIAALDLLLKALVASSNISLFKVMMGIAIRESNHPHMEQLQRSISSFALKLPLSKFMEVTDYCFDEFIKRSHSDEHRRNIVHQVLSPILKIVPPLSVSEFYVKHIVKIMSVIKRDLPRPTDVDLRRDYIERECCYELIHVLYMRLSSEFVNTKESKIVDAFTKGKTATGKELTVDVFRTANAAKFKQETSSLTPEATVLKEDYKRSAFNALAAAILCTQRKEDFFRQFLFRDNESKKEYVWENIVDVSSVGLLEDDKVFADSENDYYVKDEDESSNLGSLPDAVDSAKASDDKRGDTEHALELDAINRNPCMKMILLIIHELHTSITPPPKEMAKEESTMPSWMKDIFKKFINPSTGLNIRLFLAKIIVNMPEAFEAYAPSWIRPLMKLAMEGESYGEPMNYFVQDLCVLIVVWGESVKLTDTYEDRVLLLSFMSYLMKNCYHEQRQYLKNNIDLIKGVFENWSSIAIVPTTIIYNNFKNTRDDKKNITGIHLLGIVLTHDNPPFYKGPEIDLGTLREAEYYEALVRNMGSSSKQIYTSAAEVCGLVLAYMKRHHSMDTDFQDLVIKKLLGEERTLALEILAGRAAYLPDLFQSLQGLNFLGCLKYKDEATQFAALSIIYGLWESLTTDQIQYFLDTIILEFSSHSSVECRKLYYSILMMFFDKHSSTPAIASVLRTQLLRGLGDASESIRHTVITFWYDKNRLPTDTYQRLVEIVRNMYDTHAEDKFLYYATYMLLDRTKKSSDYSEPIFAEPLPNAKFSENYASIDTSWKNTAAMTPLFVQTQQSQSQSTQSEAALGDDELRATQSTFDFSMTLDGGAPGIRSQLGGTTHSSSTLLFNGPLQEHQSISLSQLSSLTTNQKYRRLHRRNIKVDQSTQSQRFKRAYESKVQSQFQAAIERENAKAKSVSIIRKYRDGDLPDIQIKYSDIIRPLQSLAEMDVDICRMLFSKLVTGLMAQVESHVDSEEKAHSLKEGLVSDFKQILEKSTALYTPFIGSILRICHDYGDAEIPVHLVSKVAIRSSNQHLGIILIEKQIQYLDIKERPSKRQKTSDSGSVDPKRRNWIELARIYKSIDEKDIFKSIYESKIATTNFTKEAIEAEVLGDYDSAFKLYFDGINQLVDGTIRVDAAEQDIWAHGRLECLEYLGDWNLLAANTMSDLDNDIEKEVWTEDYQDPYLHYFLTSYTKLVDGETTDGDMLIPWSADNPNPVFGFVDSAMNNPVHRQILDTKFQPELSLTAVMRKDFKQASHYVRKSYDRFLSTWSSLHPLSEKPRLHELSALQRIVELEEFLGGVDDILRSSEADPLTPLLLKWEHRFPGKTTDNMITWNNMLEDRKLMVRQLEGLYSHYSRKQETMISKHHVHNFMQKSAAARDQGNFYVASSCIEEMKSLRAPAYDICYSQLKLDLAKATVELDHSRKADVLVDSLVKFEEYIKNDRQFEPQQAAGLKMLGSRAYGLLRDLIADSKDVSEHIMTSDWARQLVKPKGSGTDLSRELQQRGFECLRSAATVKSEEHMTKKLRLTTATYCDRILRYHENDDNKDSSDLSTKDLSVYANLVIRNTLLSMRDEEIGASELFPRLLQVIEIYPSCQKLFTELVSDFPGCWVFVRWIQQMVAVLDKPVGNCVMPILTSIATHYPNALYYPLTISAENYSFERSASGEKRKADVAKLKRAVHSPLKEDFIFELRRLTNPEHLVKDWLEQAVALFQSRNRNTEQVMATFQDLYRLVLDVGNPRLGSIAKAFAAKHGPKFESLCGKAGQKLAAMSNRDFNGLIIKYCRNEILGKETPKRQGDADLLKSYSPWLNSFQSSDHEESIDIPGQYTGRTPPNGLQMATVVRFDQRVLVMSSIRKPKRICILGSDEKEHLFLVKGGEDLRLDQRIQQLFSLMNDIMQKDPQCSQQNISIGTYKVIPMSLSLGILEWVDNTKPLRHCIEGEVVAKDTWRRTQDQYNRFVASYKGDMMGYHNLFIQASREKVVKHMESLFSYFRDDYLRQSIARLAASPEAFLMLRSEFAKSLAAINVCSYILGIGDRHLENFLLDMSNGCLIPIDFGHAFGSATEVLPVPELAPFRLTRQLVSFLSPLGTKGLLEHPMVCIMKALQGKKDIILNTMDVFVKEPLLDWRKHAINQAKEQKKRGADMGSFEIDEDSTAPPAWYLQQKIDIARKKLEGHNPSYLTVRELNVGHATKPFLPALSKTAMGDKLYNVRARHGKVCTSVQGQIECLIDMATDLDILGRAWVGWMSWLLLHVHWALGKTFGAPAATSTPTTATTTTASAAKPLKPSLPRTYFVERTKSGQLPVYSEFKNAGNRPLTVIRKIQGNATALKTDLLSTYPGAEVRVNERSNQVILKGLVMDDVRQWLSAKGF